MRVNSSCIGSAETSRTRRGNLPLISDHALLMFWAHVHVHDDVLFTGLD